MSHQPLHRRPMGRLALVMTLFFCVSGGPYGLEPLVQQSGAGLALVMILAVPLVWSLPVILTVSELNARMPAEGGFYVWVKECMGPFNAFLCAWWTWLYSMVDATIYPVLLVGYAEAMLRLHFGIEFGSPLVRWMVAACIVALFTFLNLLGARTIGRVSTWFFVLLALPFVGLIFYGLSKASGASIFQPFFASGETAVSAVGAGLAVALWNYLGWDTLSTIAEEVEEPRKSYPKAMLIALPLITLFYFASVAAGLIGTPDPSQRTEDSWPAIAASVGGTWLGTVVGFAALISQAGLFMATLLGISRLPFVLAEDGYLPKAFVALHPKWGTPWRAILLCGLIYAALSSEGFLALVSVNVLLYSAGLVHEFIALIWFRVWEKRGDPRALPAQGFRIPGGWTVLFLIALLPTAVVGFAVYSSYLEEGSRPLWISAIALASGPLWYFGRTKFQRI